MAKAAESAEKAEGADSGDGKAPEPRPVCGIAMPISPVDGYPARHWQPDVLEIITEAAQAAGFDARLVSAAEHSAIILGEIVANLHRDDVVVFDVSTKNANVMFELGMRLAFDKPTVIIKDDNTHRPFDTSPIQDLEYPRDLHYQEIRKFKTDLTNKMKATYEASQKSDYRSFLKHFGQLKVASVETREVSSVEYIINSMKQMDRKLDRLEKGALSMAPVRREYGYIEIPFGENMARVLEEAEGLQNQYGAEVVRIGSNFIILRTDPRRLFEQDTSLSKIAIETAYLGSRIIDRDAAYIFD
jgi:hypothetical protein